MKRIKLLTFTAAVIISFSATANAALKPVIEATQEGFSDNINVIIKNAKSSMPITMKITNSDGEVDFYEMGYTESDGSFEFTYVNDRNSGLMDILAKVGITEINGSYYKMGDADYNKFISAVKSQHDLQNSGNPDGAVIKAVFDEYDGLFAFESMVFDSFSEQEKTNVFDIMANDASLKGEINDIEDVVNAFHTSVLVESYNTNPSDFASLVKLSPYKELTQKDGLAPVLADGLSKASETVLKKVWSEIPDSYNNAEKLFTETEFEIFNEMIKSATSWNDVKTAYTLYKDKVGINPSKADMNDYKALIGKDFSSYNAAKTAFETQISAPSATPKPSGGSGGGAVNVVIPPKTEAENNLPPVSQQTTGKLVFSDLTEAMWAIKAVNFVYEKGIISGVGDGKFEPNRAITRAEAVKLIVNMIGADETADITFTDVKQTDWFYPYVCTGYKLGIVNGRSETVFDPYSLVSRQEAAVMVYNAIKDSVGADPGSVNVNIVDEDMISAWAGDAVKYLYAKGIISGRDGSRFDPLDNMTRAEAATVIYNCLK